jgi:hypothetical protein
MKKQQKRHGAWRWASLSALASLLAALVAQPPSAAGSPSGVRQSVPRTATVVVVTSQEFRVAVIARQVSGGSTPTAEVRVGVARRVGGSWREFAERRLGEEYFWKTVSRPHAICRLAIETVGTRRRPGSQVTVRLLISPSIGCGRTYTLPLPTR